jgi:CO/xanthine dehydrogenase Mo-binding subunit
MNLWKYTASKTLGIDEKQINVVAYNDIVNSQSEQDKTGKRFESPIEALSVHCSVINNLILKACLTIKKARFRESLPIVVEKTYRPLKKQSVLGTTWDEHSFSHPSLAAAVVEVEIDRVEWAAKIKQVCISVYAGKIHSYTQACHAINISTIAALGWSASEKLNYSEGRITSSCYNYGIIKPSEIPHIKINYIENENEALSGLKELPFNTVPAAYLQAVSQSLDCEFSSIPFNSISLWQAEENINIEEEKEGSIK